MQLDDTRVVELLYQFAYTVLHAALEAFVGRAIRKRHTDTCAFMDAFCEVVQPQKCLTDDGWNTKSTVVRRSDKIVAQYNGLDELTGISHLALREYGTAVRPNGCRFSGQRRENRTADTDGCGRWRHPAWSRRTVHHRLL
jgi:hypothetical protein